MLLEYVCKVHLGYREHKSSSSQARRGTPDAKDQAGLAPRHLFLESSFVVRVEVDIEFLAKRETFAAKKTIVN